MTAPGNGERLPPELPPRLEPRVAIIGAERQRLGKLLRAWYEAGVDAELLAVATGRSEAWTWTVLTEAGTRARPRCGTGDSVAVRTVEAYVRSEREGPQ